MDPNINSIKQQSSMSNGSQSPSWLQAESKGSSRRHFLATCSWLTAMLGLPAKALCQIYTEKPNIANDGDMFRPGDAVPASGIYDVIHDKLDGQEHAGQHQITAIAGKTFPLCRGCQAWVRYRLYRAAEYIQENEYFKE
ncbi:MAG: hypothetical protein ABSA83_14715 [Verrucomicrobiota bacterium]|jgi:hypothetical protein